MVCPWQQCTASTLARGVRASTRFSQHHFTLIGAWWPLSCPRSALSTHERTSLRTALAAASPSFPYTTRLPCCVAPCFLQRLPRCALHRHETKRVSSKKMKRASTSKRVAAHKVKRASTSKRLVARHQRWVHQRRVIVISNRANRIHSRNSTSACVTPPFSTSGRNRQTGQDTELERRLSDRYAPCTLHSASFSFSTQVCAYAGHVRPFLDHSSTYETNAALCVLLTSLCVHAPRETRMHLHMTCVFTSPHFALHLPTSYHVYVTTHGTTLHHTAPSHLALHVASHDITHHFFSHRITPYIISCRLRARPGQTQRW